MSWRKTGMRGLLVDSDRRTEFALYREVGRLTISITRRRPIVGRWVERPRWGFALGLWPRRDRPLERRWLLRLGRPSKRKGH